MNIGLVLEDFDPSRGGLANWTWQFAVALSERGHEVHIVALEFADEACHPSLHLHRATKGRSPFQKAAALEEQLRNLRLDVIHDMGCGWSADVFHLHGGSSVAHWEQSLLRIPRWRQIRFWREPRYRERLEIEARQHARTDARVVVISEMVRNDLIRYHHLPPDRMRLIYNGVDGDHFSPERRRETREPFRRALGCQNGETLFLLVSLDLVRKNAEAAISALATVVASGDPAHLAIVGAGHPKRFVRLSQKLGISNRVHFFDAVREIRPFYGAADVFVLPTWYDPCSLSTLEALACGLPVITTRFNGVAEMITDGVEGHILDDPSDYKTLALRMQRLLDPETRAKAATNARQLALEHTFERQVEEFLDLYRDIMNSRRSGASPCDDRR
jgi:UDP-glucose:(heptosyl)LPS alpha-1,3-glucosyltransferase